MSEDKKNEEKTTKVNVIRRAAPQHKAEEPVQHQAEAEKKVIVLKKKPVVVKVKEKEEEKKPAPLDYRPGNKVELASSDIRTPVITRPANLPPLEPVKKAEASECPYRQELHDEYCCPSSELKDTVSSS